MIIPPDVVRFYIRGDFVYCSFLLVLLQDNRLFTVKRFARFISSGIDLELLWQYNIINLQIFRKIGISGGDASMKRTLALLLSLAMIITMIPATVLAAGSPPQNPRWSTGDSLAATWDYPADATDDTLIDYYFDICFYYSENPDGPWELVDSFDDWMKDNYVLLQGHAVAEHGCGYYKFAVRCSDSSINGESEWVESDVYHLNFSVMDNRAPQPGVGGLNYETEVLEWEESETSSLYTSIIEVWYMGTDATTAEAQWERVDRVIAGYTSSYALSNVISPYKTRDWETGWYAFKVSYFPENYLECGESLPRTLDYEYEHTSAVALPTPTGAAWTANKTLIWDIPTDTTNLDYYEVEIMYSESQLDDPGANWVTTEDFSYSAEMLNSPYAWEEVGYIAHSVMRDYGSGWYYFRVKACADNLTINSDSDWGYSAGVETSPVPLDAPTELEWHRYYTDNGANYTTEAGRMSFRMPEGSDPHDHVIHLYQVNENGDDIELTDIYSYSFAGNYVSRSASSSLTPDCSYYYTVKAEGDGVNTTDSPVVTSGIWTFDPPYTIAVYDVEWDPDTMQMLWSTPDDDVIEEMEIELFFTATEGEVDVDNAIGTYTAYSTEEFFPHSSDLEFVDGWYYFRVRAVSGDLLNYANSDWVLSDGFYYTAPADKAPAPTNLGWDLYYDHDGMTSTNPGCMSFRGVEDSQYELKLYRKDEYYDQQIFRTSMNCWSGWCNFDYFAGSPEDCVTGTYYFTAQAKGDGISTSDSDIVTSAEWTYTRPEKVLSATNLSWDGLAMDFEAEEELVEKYEVDIYFNSAEDNTSQAYYVYSESYYPDELPIMLPSSVLDQHGDGWYYYKVLLYTTDITKAVTSSYSAYSPAFHYTKPTKTLNIFNPQWDGDGGSMAWGYYFPGASAYVDHYEVRIYYSNSAETLPNVNDWVGWETFTPEDASRIPDWVLMDNGTGYYYFTVRAITNNPMVANSGEWSEMSSAFAYTAPEALTVSDIGWDGMNPIWTDNFDSTAPLKYYDVRYYFGKTEDSVNYKEQIWWTSYDDNEQPTMPKNMLREYGPGYYAFQVRPISSDVTVALTGEWSAFSPVLHVEGPSATVAPASDPQWHLWRWSDGDSKQEMGAISFSGTVSEGAEYAEFRVDIYRREGDNSVHIGNTQTRIWEGDAYSCFRPFERFADQFITGTYYFTVTGLGDGVTTADSEPVASADWNYVRPDAQPTVSQPVWNKDMSMSWTDGGTGQASYYQIQFQYVGAGDKFYEDRWDDSTSYWPEDDDKAIVTDWILRNNGSGKYYFRVRAMSEDVTECVPSVWSEWSAAFDYTKPSVTLTATNLQWKTDTYEMLWSMNADESVVDHYEIQFYYSKTANKPSEAVDWYWFDANDAPYTLPSRLIADYGSGYYWFEVCAVSGDPTKAFSGDYSQPSNALHYAGASGKLGTPTELMWHKEVETNWKNGQITGYTFIDRMGSIAFKRAMDENGNIADQARYYVHIYEVGKDEPVAEHSWGFGSNNQREYLDVSSFIYDDLPSGTYYFQIRARGDGINYDHGDWVDSRDYAGGTWTYVKPDAQLAVPTGLHWNDTDYTDEEDNILIASCWEPVDGAAYYEVDFYFAENENRKPESWGGSFDIRADDDPFDYLWDDLISDCGPGLYYTRVRAISPDITKISNGEWSELSPAYDLRDTVNRVNGALDSLLPSQGGEGEPSEAPSAEVIQETIANIDLLDEAMASDAAKGTAGTLEKLEQLEAMVKEELGVDTHVEVGDGLADRFDVPLNDLTFTAANMALNVDVEAAKENTETTTVQLNISDAKNDVIPPSTLIDTQKNNTLVFSMDIENAVDADPETDSMDLKIPVQITLPIPKDINRAFLVILHEKSDGTWEELFLPHVFQNGGQWYATFNVTSFSNYAMGEKSITAEVSGNTVTLEAHLPAVGTDTQYLCAVYSAQDQMLGMDILQPWANERMVITLDQPVPAGAYVKIFAPDAGDGWAVHSDAITVEITR